MNKKVFLNNRKELVSVNLDNPLKRVTKLFKTNKRTSDMDVVGSVSGRIIYSNDNFYHIGGRARKSTKKVERIKPFSLDAYATTFSLEADEVCIGGKGQLQKLYKIRVRYLEGEEMKEVIFYQPSEVMTEIPEEKGKNVKGDHELVYTDENYKYYMFSLKLFYKVKNHSPKNATYKNLNNINIGGIKVRTDIFNKENNNTIKAISVVSQNFVLELVSKNYLLETISKTAITDTL